MHQRGRLQGPAGLFVGQLLGRESAQLVVDEHAAGNPVVGLSAPLLQSTHMSAPPPPEAAVMTDLY
jgi:hypothetical protein